MTGTIVISLVDSYTVPVSETISIGQLVREKKGVQNTLLMGFGPCGEGSYYYFKVLSKIKSELFSFQIAIEVCAAT